MEPPPSLISQPKQTQHAQFKKMSKAPVPRSQKSESSYLTFFNRSVGDISDPKWRELIEHQDYDTLIIEIREDILAQVTEECYKKYLKREVYKFLIECAHKAFKQILTLHFYTYDDSHKYTSSRDTWLPDEEPQICKPDSWAKGNIPYNTEDVPRTIAQQTDNVCSDYHLVQCEYPSTDVFDTTSSRSEPDFGEEQSPCVSLPQLHVRMRDASAAQIEASQTSVQFNNTYSTSATNYDFMHVSTEMVPTVPDVQANRNISENLFYKIMRVNMASSLSLATTPNKPKKFNPPAWTCMDEVRNDPRRDFSPSRYLQMRRECLANVERKPLSKKTLL